MGKRYGQIETEHKMGQTGREKSQRDKKKKKKKKKYKDRLAKMSEKKCRKR